MSKHYSSDNECILTGGLWALIIALIIGGLSLFFAAFWPTAIVIFAVALLIGLIVAFFMCKTRTVGRGGVDMRAVDLARAEMGGAAPAAAAVDDGEADAAAAKAKAAAKSAADTKAKADATKAKADVDAKAAADKKADAKAAKAKSNAKAKADKAAKAKADAKAADDHAHEGEVGEGEAKPELLTEARGGKADDLKKIKGVGPKLEKELNAAGVFHFDQIASWTVEEVYWADHHLVSFKGRVSRDNWVDQAKELAK
jgi:predicted flap endonuclease-1-like 5' DNA nuclease